MELEKSSNHYHPFQLHICTCDNNIEEVKRLLGIPFYKDNIDLRDNQGYPATHYAAHFGYKDILELLLNNGADPTKKSFVGWSLLQEALGRKDKEIVTLLLQRTKLKIHDVFKSKRPKLMTALQNIPDFEMELNWEFKSWVPLVSRFCPYDTYKIYKKGTSFRVNTTITGFEGITFKRGELSVMFIGDKKRLFLVNFGKKEYQELSLLNVGNGKEVEEEEVTMLMTAKSITRAKLLHEDITFSPCKSWLGYEKFEKVGGDTMGWNSQMFNVSNIDLKVLSRKNKYDQKPKKDKHQHQLTNDTTTATTTTTTTTTNNNEIEASNVGEETNVVTSPKLIVYKMHPSTMRSKIQSKDYFQEPIDFDPTNENRDKSKIKTQGLLCDGESVTVKHNKYDGTVWISKEFPRTITDLVPIFEVLSPTNKLFSRLTEFISMKLPTEGFPVKLDFPVLPTITATVTFTNYIEKEVDDSQFSIPTDFQHTKQLKF